MSGVSIDLTGETFGNLKVIRRVKNNHNRQPRWLCECKCGNTYIAEGATSSLVRQNPVVASLVAQRAQQP